MSRVQQVSRPLRKFENVSNISESDCAPATGASRKPQRTPELPRIAHWALRVEKQAQGGDNDDPLTWNYFAIVGKLDANGNRVFHYDRRQFHPTHIQDLGQTLQSKDYIDQKGNELVKDAEPYQLILNNCQAFVYVLWLCIKDPNMLSWGESAGFNPETVRQEPYFGFMHHHDRPT